MYGEKMQKRNDNEDKVDIDCKQIIFYKRIINLIKFNSR